MGKESKLRNPKPDERTGSRFSYSNGDRKLYDRDKRPEGTDEDVWNLALYFENMAEKYGYQSPGRPIIYTELYHRIVTDEDFSGILGSGLDKPASDVLPTLSAKCNPTGTYDIDPLVLGYTSIEDLSIYILFTMIEDYWNTDDNYDYDHSINNFCDSTIFFYIKNNIVDKLKRRILLSTGVRVVQEDTDLQPSRRTEEEKEVAAILLGTREPGESLGKLKKFKEEH